MPVDILMNSPLTNSPTISPPIHASDANISRRNGCQCL